VKLLMNQYGNNGASRSPVRITRLTLFLLVCIDVQILDCKELL
jgi:hypothetical protein